MIRRRIVFRGRVQGVGFRYRARMAAAQIGVTGWVRNNPDGTVTMEIQGTEEQIDSVIIAIEITDSETGIPEWESALNILEESKKDYSMYPPVHERPENLFTFERLDMLWERYPQYHDMSTFATLDELLEEHESYRKDFEDLREEYEANHYDRFLVQLSWSDLAYRHATKELIEAAPHFEENAYVKSFIGQFADIDTDRKACFLFPESFVTIWRSLTNRTWTMYSSCTTCSTPIRPVKFSAVIRSTTILFHGIKIIFGKMAWSSDLRICLTDWPNIREICLITTIPQRLFM